ncbi:hypothetical protein BJV77DRAFT_125495 [Russula vinacea]|nr:hypothetical protein BJV77DRAFT_125495 [Russula vinacea]
MPCLRRIESLAGRIVWLSMQLSLRPQLASTPYKVNLDSSDQICQMICLGVERCCQRLASAKAFCSSSATHSAPSDRFHIFRPSHHTVITATPCVNRALPMVTRQCCGYSIVLCFYFSDLHNGSEHRASSTANP